MTNNPPAEYRLSNRLGIKLQATDYRLKQSV
jgi:hypothetical protein